MARGDWTERGIAWDDITSDDGMGYDKPTISFVDDLEGGAWYDVDVTAAVQDALENHEPRLGIRRVGRGGLSLRPSAVARHHSRRRIRPLTGACVAWWPISLAVCCRSAS